MTRNLRPTEYSTRRNNWRSITRWAKRGIHEYKEVQLKYTGDRPVRLDDDGRWAKVRSLGNTCVEVELDGHFMRVHGNNISAVRN